MFVRYVSNYPNEVHQLVVAVSRHIRITSTGLLHFQKKPMEVSLLTLGDASKEHIVHYMIRDHFSGVFYGEMHPSASLIPVEDFLFRAWSQKQECLFCGAPEGLSIPETVNKAFPSLRPILPAWNIEEIKVTSGFQGGIRDIRTWEDYIRQFASLRDDLKTFVAWQSRTCRLSAYLNGDPKDPASKIAKWNDLVRVINIPRRPTP
jgi:hypothetical protein